jgi:ABC-type transport system involved in cytochrome bd biosynthesis fused ATPase/permease subunit
MKNIITAILLIVYISVVLIGAPIFNYEYLNSNVSPYHIENTKAEYMKSGSDYMQSLEE